MGSSAVCCLLAGRYLVARGVTSVGDMGWGLFGDGGNAWVDLEHVYDAAAQHGKMPVRCQGRSATRVTARDMAIVIVPMPLSADDSIAGS